MTDKLRTIQSKKSEPAPVWFAVLRAAGCYALGKGGQHEVHFDLAGGRALYTNSGATSEWIQQLEVEVASGHTLAVFWVPGETAYSTEVYLQPASVAA